MEKRVKADYRWGIKNDVLWIVDLNRGGMSVTNCVEDVVGEIYYVISQPESILEPEKVKRMRIIYQDSEGMWDGWDNKRQEFIHIQASSLDSAIDLILVK